MSKSNSTSPEEERKAKQKARVKAWQEANKEKIAAQHKARYEAKKEEITTKRKAYYEANKEACQAQKRAYYEANKEKCTASNKAWREANLEKAKAREKAYREVNKAAFVAYQKEWRKANPDRQKLSSRVCHLRRKYDLTLDQFNSMLEACDYRCQCCKTPFSEILNEQPRVDHCHKTGTIRGLLCQRCNRLLGDAEDNPSILRACARYLEAPRLIKCKCLY